MCDPITMAAVGATQSALQISSVNRSLEAEGEGVNEQAERAYLENAYDAREQATAAVDEGFIADINRQKAIGSAKVAGAGLGIRGTTANELVAEEDQIGTFNVNSAEGARRQADTAYTIGTKGTQAAAATKIKGIQAQAPTAFESMVSIAAGGLSGYMGGTAIQEATAAKKLAAAAG